MKSLTEIVNLSVLHSPPVVSNESAGPIIVKVERSNRIKQTSEKHLKFNYRKHHFYKYQEKGTELGPDFVNLTLIIDTSIFLIYFLDVQFNPIIKINCVIL